MINYLLISLKLLMFLIFTGCAQLQLLSNSTSSRPQNTQNSYGTKVRQRLIENVPNYRFCLEKFLGPTESGTFKGAVTFAFEINKHGTIRDVLVTSDQLKNIKAKGCLIKVITMMEMPKHNKKKNFKVKQPMGISMQ